MSYDLEAMRNNFYQFSKDGFKSLTIYTQEKIDNKKDLTHLATLYGLKVKFKVRKGAKQNGTFKAKTH